MTECDLAQHVELPNAEAQRTATGDMQSEHNPCMTGVAGEGMHAFWGGHAQLSWKGLSKEQDGTLRFEQFPWQNAYRQEAWMIICRLRRRLLRANGFCARGSSPLPVCA